MEAVRVLNLFTLMDRGGAETMCMNLYRNIDRSKVQFDFLVYYPQRGAYEDEIEALGGHVYRIPHLKNFPAHIRWARRFFQEHKEISIVHDHMGSNGAFICREAKQAGVETIIYHAHTAPITIFGMPPKLAIRGAFNHVMERIAWKSCNVYFACGNEAAEGFAVPLEDVHILKNAIDLGRFSFDPAIRESVREELQCGEALVLGNVARLNANKNQRFLLNVLKRLLLIQPDSLLLLVGEGPLHGELEKQANDLGIADKVKFLGVRNDVDRLLQAVDIFLFSSIKEGLPVTCIEAQAAGLPCIISDSIDPKAAVTDRCKALSLNDPIEKWVRSIIDSAGTERKDMTSVMREAGYDIRETSMRMQQFYLDCGKGTCEKDVV